MLRGKSLQIPKIGFKLTISAVRRLRFAFLSENTQIALFMIRERNALDSEEAWSLLRNTGTLILFSLHFISLL